MEKPRRRSTGRNPPPFGTDDLPVNRLTPANITAFLDRTIAWASERKERLRTVGLVGALIVFAVGLILALRGTPELSLNFHLAPLLALIVLGAPAGTLLNTIELYLLSRLAGGQMSLRASAEITVYTSAANMLPLPGGALTKLAGMKAHGVGYRTASALVILSFLAWAGFTFFLASFSLLSLGQATASVIFGALGVAILIVCGIGFARFRRWREVAVIALLRIAFFLVEMLRYWLALMAIGAQASLVQCSTLVVASVVGAAIVIAPQGLGVIEATAAMLATLVGISAGLGFVSAAIQRITRLIGLAIIATGFILTSSKAPNGQV